MAEWQLQQSKNTARSLIVSQRGYQPLTWLCLGYEFEDLIGDLEPADIITAPAEPQNAAWRMGTKALERCSGGRWSLSTTYRPATERHYDLAFAHCGTVWALLSMGSQRNFARLAKYSACYISELWASRLPLPKAYLHRLQCFDAVFIGCASPVEELSAAIGRPCYYLPPAVDVLATCPYPNPPERSIDVLSVGRRVEEIHLQLLAHSAENPQFFYLRDTIRHLSKGQVTNTRDHRQQLLAQLKRAKFFIANRPKFDQSVGADTSEVGYRFFEGAAAGCVMIGDPPRNAAFDELFGWPDVVIPNPEEASGIIPLIHELESDPARVERIRLANVVHSLRHHDWAHRWQVVLDVLGLPPSPALQARLSKLERLANELEHPEGVRGISA